MASIIHFTKEYNSLKGILTEKAFRLHYCREVFYLGNEIASSAVHPMVSFSEQVVGSLDKKNITYVKFGIAMKWEWVNKRQLHPVIYLDKESHLAKALATLLKARRNKDESKKLPSRLRLSIMTLKCFTKNAIGYNSFFNMEDFNFKAEKEWRYVPTKSQIDGKLISVTKRVYEKKSDYYNNSLEAYPLKFSLKDLECIFVQTETQRQEISILCGLDVDKIRTSKWSAELLKAKTDK